MKKINMFIDTDSIFFKIAYNDASNKELSSRYDKFCRAMELEVKNKLMNPFDEEEGAIVLGRRVCQNASRDALNFLETCSLVSAGPVS